MLIDPDRMGPGSLHIDEFGEILVNRYNKDWKYRDRSKDSLSVEAGDSPDWEPDPPSMREEWDKYSEASLLKLSRNFIKVRFIIHMIIYRRIFGNIDSQIKKEKIEKIFKTTFDWGYFSKDIDQNSIEYANLLPFIKQFNLNDDILGVEFSKQEVLDAEILCFMGAKAFSYPEPQEPMFLDNAYSDYCKECGTHEIQKRDFEIKKEPKSDSLSLGMLHWVFDELFIGTEVSRSFFLKQLKLLERPVKIYKKSKNADSVVQLVVDELDCDLDMIGVEGICCKVCNKTKYLPTVTGFFSLPQKRNFDLIKTREFFGSGKSASHRILMSNDIMQQMIKLKIANHHQFVPCKSPQLVQADSSA